MITGQNHWSRFRNVLPTDNHNVAKEDVQHQPRNAANHKVQHAHLRTHTVTQRKWKRTGAGEKQRRGFFFFSFCGQTSSQRIFPCLETQMQRHICKSRIGISFFVVFVRGSTMERSLWISKDTSSIELPFHTCMVDAICGGDATGPQSVGVHLIDDPAARKYTLTKSDAVGSTVLGHSPVCPFRALQSEPAQVQTAALTSFEQGKRRLKFAVCVLVESKDGLVLMTRRRDDISLFPSVWVLPGGHVEKGESLQEAGARELLEETGISVDPSAMRTLLLWESCFPQRIQMGLPRSHHFVAMMVVKLDSEPAPLKLQACEVSAGAWLTRSELAAWLRLEQGPSASEVLDAPARATECIRRLGDDGSPVMGFGALRPDNMPVHMMLADERLALGHCAALLHWFADVPDGLVATAAAAAAV
jgi:8-oxo-dGTP pyrophosphatase MutT (NUDIX family)